MFYSLKFSVDESSNNVVLSFGKILTKERKEKYIRLVFLNYMENKVRLDAQLVLIKSFVINKEGITTSRCIAT